MAITDEMIERDRLAAARLRRHVPEVALRWMAEQPDRTWCTVEGTLCFADVSGFTALSERLESRGRRGAEELVDTLNRVFGAIVDVAVDRGGDLLKFGGDALLFLFSGPDHARRAAATAVELRSELRRAADEPTAFGRLRLAMSVGMASGDIHLFLVGDPRELVVAGPVLDATIRAEGAALAGETLLAPSTAALLPARASKLHADEAHARLRWRRPPADVPVRQRTLPPADPATLPSLLPKPLADALGAGVEPGHRSATISFVRMSGTDAALERGPEVLVAALDATMRVVQAALDDEGLTLLTVDVDRDGAKCFCAAGLPTTSEDDEGRMLRSLRTIVTTPAPLHLQAGVNRGHVFAAAIGSDDRASYSAMGDTTNTAARIAAKAPRGQLYAHPAVLERARTRYDARPVGPFEFKGKTEPLTVFDVGDAAGLRDELSQEHRLPMLGRAAESAVVAAAIQRATDGTGGTLLVTGAAGVGKTRLARETVNDSGLARDVARAEPYGSTSTYRPLRDPIREMLGVERGAPEKMAAALLTALDEIAPDLRPFAPLIGDVAHIEVPSTPEVDAIGSRYRPDRTADVVIDLIGRVHPGAFIIGAEDAQWADEATAYLFTRIEAATLDRPWLFVVLRREGSGGFTPVGGERIELGPLGDDVIRDLAVAATEARPLRPHEIDAVVEQAAGSPQYVDEWARASRLVGSLDTVPDSINAVVSAQVDALSPLARRALGVAAVLGRSFRREVLAAVLAAEGCELDAPVWEELHGLLETDGEARLRFRNGLVREVVYEGMAYRARARIHRVAGETIEAASDDVAGDAEVLAEHFWRAGDGDRTWRYSLIAADRARNGYASADAAMHLERAADVGRHLAGVTDAERYERLLQLGEVRERAGMFDDALNAYDRARRVLAGDATDHAELLLLRARAHERAGDYPAALRTTTRADHLVESVASGRAAIVRADALAFRALVRQRQEHAQLAMASAETAFEAGGHAGSILAQARASKVISWASMMLGRDDAESWGSRALALYEQVGDHDGQADLANNLGGLAFFDGHWDRTLALYRQSRLACERVGNLLDAASTDANIGEVLVSQGRLDEAEPLLRDAMRVLRSSGHRLGAAFAEMHLGRLLTARGDDESAIATLASVREQFAALGRGASVHEASLYLADALNRAGRSEQALAVLADGAHATTEDISIFDAARARIRAGAFTAMGDLDAAGDQLELGIAVARQRALGYELGLLLAMVSTFPRPVPSGSDEDPATESARLLAGLGVRAAVDVGG